MQTAIYARVSSESQAKEGTIDSQIAALHDYAKAHALIITREFIDNGFSGDPILRLCRRGHTMLCPYAAPRLRFATCGIFAAISDPEKHRVFENTCRLRAEKSARHLRQ